MLVLTGLHTFGGMMREAYPVNHFLLIAIYGLAAFALAESRGGILVDAAGCAVLRVAGLHMVGNTVGERQTGFGTEMLTTSELRVRFGGTPWLLYAYTIVCSMLTVPFSQPGAGQWTAFAPG